ncbi:MAG: hypothetical protein QOH95_163 [Gaiellaceae bacterium]|jgi:CheY-like chemotaxis protein|nr:hypothetical protein [Gaiellaceae bacterium]
MEETVARRVVLVVDDEPDIRYLLRTALEAAGYEVVEAAHGEAALEMMEQALPHVVVTDWMMPRMDGGELIDQLRADTMTRSIPIVIVSSTNREPGRADAVLGKPFDPGELILVVDRLTGKER